MSLLSPKKDSLGQDIFPGDVCIRQVKDKRKFNSTIEFCVYKGDSWGGSESKGEFGRFITPSGTRSIKYTSVVFAFDPMSKRRATSNQITELVREFYEGK